MYYYALPLLIVLTVLIVLFYVNCINCIIVIIVLIVLFPGEGDPTPSCTTILHISQNENLCTIVTSAMRGLNVDASDTVLCG